MMKARLFFTAGVVLSTMLSIPAIAVPASRGTTAGAARTAQAQTATMPDGTELWGNVIA